MDESDNVSPFEGYPVCSVCGVGAIMCEECYDSLCDLFYVEKIDEILCKECLIEYAEKHDIIHSAKRFFDEDWHEIGSDDDYEPIVEHIKSRLDLQEVKP